MGRNGSLGGIRGVKLEAETSILLGDLNPVGKVEAAGWGEGLQGVGSLGVGGTLQPS